MNRFHNIFYISRGVEDETEGLKQALSLARNNHANLTVMVLTPELPRQMQAYREKFAGALESEMRACVTAAAEAVKIDATELDYALVFDTDTTPATKIIKEILRKGYDLVIKEAESKEAGKGFRAVDMDLLRKCPCPVWLCRSISKPRAQINYAVAIDPECEEKQAEALSVQMLGMARALADSCSGRLSIVSCWDFEFEEFLRHNPWAPVPEREIQESGNRAQTEHRAALDALIAQAGIDGEDNVVLHYQGKPDNVIPKFVEDQAIDVLVMGTLARTGIPGVTIGNTAENILQKLSCSLLALKPHGFVSPVKA